MDIADYEKTKLLLPLNGANDGVSFPDYSPQNLTVTAYGGAATKTAQYKYYDSSAYFDGTGDYLTVPSTGFPTSDNFTLQGWARTSVTSSYCCLLTRPSASGFTSGALSLFFNPDATNGRLILFVADYSTSTALITASSGGINDGAWHHFALTRSSSTWTLWVDGESVGTGTSSATIAALSQPIYIGQDPNFSGRTYTGYLQDIHIVTGTALYSSAFTPPGKLTGTINNNGSGVAAIKDDANAAAIRSVYATPRTETVATRNFITQSDSNGRYSLQVPMTTCNVVFEDNAAGTQYSDILVSHVTPT
jgi:hypothetical protein